MNKLEYFKINVPYVDEDGTKEELEKILLIHRQENVENIKRAAKEISYLINFCMDIATTPFNKTKNEYTILNFDTDEIDYTDIMISVRDGTKYKTLHIDSEEILNVNYPNIKVLISMLKEMDRISFTDNLTDEENDRREIYGCHYNYILSKMLDGYFYMSE